MAQALLQRGDERTEAMRDTISDLLSFEGPRAELAGLLSGLDVGYDLGEGHPLLGRRMPDLDLATAHGQRRVFELLHDARPVLLNLGAPDSIDITPWTDRVQHINADHTAAWELPVIGTVTAPVAVSIRPDGRVAWVGENTGRAQQSPHDLVRPTHKEGRRITEGVRVRGRAADPPNTATAYSRSVRRVSTSQRLHWIDLAPTHSQRPDRRRRKTGDRRCPCLLYRGRDCTGRPRHHD